MKYKVWFRTYYDYDEDPEDYEDTYDIMEYHKGKLTVGKATNIYKEMGCLPDNSEIIRVEKIL